jgi:hypothetical protein
MPTYIIEDRVMCRTARPFRRLDQQGEKSYNRERLTKQPSVRLEIKVKLGWVRDFSVDDGAGLAVTAPIRVVLRLREESGQNINQAIKSAGQPYLT